MTSKSVSCHNQELKSCLDNNDFESSSTALMIDTFIKVLQTIKDSNIKRILDIGCGYGGIAIMTGKYFGAERLLGMEISDERAKYSRAKGMEVIKADVDTALPLTSQSFDLVMCNGVLCHLPTFDNVITESFRLLRPNGYIIYTLPNMCNFINRTSMLLGYQPTDALISGVIRTGTIFMNGKPSSTHIHGATPAAMKELLEYYHFERVKIYKGNPRLIGPYAGWWPFFKTLGYVLPVGLSRRLIVVANKRDGVEH